jgi:hypothetical protein
LPRGFFHPAKNSPSGKNCPVRWANTSTFRKNEARESQQNRGKNWFTPEQHKVKDGYATRAENRDGKEKAGTCVPTPARRREPERHKSSA